jgi:hypothetical protein
VLPKAVKNKLSRRRERGFGKRIDRTWFSALSEELQAREKKGKEFLAKRRRGRQGDN